MKKLFAVLMMVCVVGCVDERGRGASGDTSDKALEICEVSMDYSPEDRIHRIMGERLPSDGLYRNEEIRSSLGGMEGYYDTDHVNRLTVDVACGVRDGWPDMEDCFFRRVMVLIPVSDMEYWVCNIMEIKFENGRELEDYEITNLSQVPLQSGLFPRHEDHSSCVVEVIYKVPVGETEDEGYEYQTFERSRPMEVVKCGEPIPKWRT